PEGQRIVLCEVAVAVSRARAFVDRCAENAAERGVGRCERERRHATVLFAYVGLEVVAQAVVEREFARDLPGVLKIEVNRMAADLRIFRRIHRDRIHLAKQEAAVWETDVAAAEILAVGGRQAGLRSGEAEVPGNIVEDLRRIAADVQLAAELIRVIAL